MSEEAPSVSSSEEETDASGESPGSVEPADESDESAGSSVPPIRDESAASFVAPPVPENSGELTEARVLRARPEPLTKRVLRRATFGLVDLGESQDQILERKLTGLAQTEIPSHHRVAVLSLKGGSGKTTTTTVLGQTLATLRGDHVVAVDANPDRGTLGSRVGLKTAQTVRDLLEFERVYGVTSQPHLRQFLSQALPSRLFVLASDRDAATSNAFSAEDFATVARILERFVSLAAIDCGTGLLFNALSGERGVLDQADQVIIACGPSVDEAMLASATLDYLTQHRWGHLAERAIVVMNKVPDAKALKRSPVDLDEIESHFSSKVNHVLRIPYDAHIAEGGQIELEKLAPETRRAFLHVAAVVGSGFNRPVRVPETAAALQRQD